jgi:hypothetical protein
MFLHLRAVANQLYLKSQNELRITASSSTAGHYETFYVSCPGGMRDGSVVSAKAFGDQASLGLDQDGYLGAGREPELQFAVEKVSGAPQPAIEDGDTIALRAPRLAWLPWQRYVKMTPSGLLFAKGKRDKETEFVVVKAREIERIALPEQDDAGHGTVVLKAAAPVGGVPITISSSHAEIISVQESVLIPEGESEGTFTVTRQPARTADSPTEVVITAFAVATGDSVSLHAPVKTGNKA